jgi:hypothetical protein
MNKKIIVIIIAAVIGTGSTTYVLCKSHTDEAQKQKEADREAVRKFLNQGDGAVRKPNTSGFKGF